MFRGNNTISMDAKGRIAIPTRYRERIQERCSGQLVLTIDISDRCLLLYPLPDWEAIEQKVNAMPNMDPNTRRLQRLLIGHATEVEMDASGRFLLPTRLQEYALIEKRVVLLGQGKKFELWAEERWMADFDAMLAAPGDEQLNEAMSQLSL